jgi:hypothetical protein
MSVKIYNELKEFDLSFEEKELSKSATHITDAVSYFSYQSLKVYRRLTSEAVE